MEYEYGIMEEIFQIISCIEMLANDIKMKSSSSSSLALTGLSYWVIPTRKINSATKRHKTRFLCIVLRSHWRFLHRPTQQSQWNQHTTDCWRLWKHLSINILW